MKFLVTFLLLLPLTLYEAPKPLMNFDTSFDHLLIHEGGYSNVKADPGGETMMGITKATAAAHGYDGPMQALPLEVAKSIYKASYWDKVKADELPEALKFHVFDAAVNSGTTQAIKWLQRSVGVADDGIIGPATIKAAKESDVGIAVALYTGERLAFMTRLKTWPVFGAGWARRIASNLQLTGA